MMFPGMNGFGGLGAPGQRESKVENFESRVKIPLAQYFVLSVTVSILGICDGLFLFMLIRALGAEGTWFVIGLAALPLVFVVVRRFSALRRYQYPIAVATIAAVAWWYRYGYDEIFLYNWPAWYEVSFIIPAMMALVLGAFQYFARYFLWGMRSDMTDANFPPTRRPISGDVGPLGPDTQFKSLVPEAEPSQSTILLHSNDARKFVLPSKKEIGLFELAQFLSQSEVNDKGLLSALAKTCGIDRAPWKELVHHLQEAGLATPNGQGVPSRLTKSYILVLQELGFRDYAEVDDTEDADTDAEADAS